MPAKKAAAKKSPKAKKAPAAKRSPAYKGGIPYGQYVATDFSVKDDFDRLNQPMYSVKLVYTESEKKNGDGKIVRYRLQGKSVKGTGMSRVVGAAEAKSIEKEYGVKAQKVAVKPKAAKKEGAGRGRKKKSCDEIAATCKARCEAKRKSPAKKASAKKASPKKRKGGRKSKKDE